MRILGINENIVQIEQKFKPESIVPSPIYYEEYKLVEKFQESSLKLITKWKEVSSIDHMDEFKDNDSKEIGSVIISHQEVFDAFQECAIEVLKNIKNILDYGNEHFIPEYSPNKAKIVKLINTMNNRNAIHEQLDAQLRKNIDELNRKYGNEFENIPTKDLKNAARPLYKMFHGEETLILFEELTSELLSLNSSYMIRINFISRKKTN